jgi:hypothetical protein
LPLNIKAGKHLLPVQLTEAVGKNLPDSFESIHSVAILDVQNIEGGLEILAEMLDLVL